MVATLLDSEVVGFADGNGGHVYNFPLGAPSVNDLDILCVNSNTTVTTPSGFTLRVNATNNQGAYIYSRKAVGGEASSVTITTSGNENTTLTWSRWSGTDAFSAGNFQRADNANGTTLPATTTGALAATNMLVVAFGAVHNFDGALATSPIWINSWNAMEAGSQGAAGSSAACVAFTAYKTNAGTASETISSVSWTNNGRNRYALWVAFTSSGAADQNVSPSSIASAEAFGNATLTNLNTIAPGGIASAEAFGNATITNLNIIAPTGIASGEAFGNATLTNLNTIAPNDIASAEAFGMPVVAGEGTVAPGGIASAEVFGTPTVTAEATIAPVGIGTAEAFGVATLTPGAVSILPASIASAEAFGIPTVAHGDIAQFINPIGIPSEEAFGTPIVWKHVVRACDCSLLVDD